MKEVKANGKFFFPSLESLFHPNENRELSLFDIPSEEFFYFHYVSILMQ